jgi:hypothetical protein
MMLAFLWTLIVLAGSWPPPTKVGAAMKFDCKQAHRLLDRPEASVVRCDELLTDFHRVVLRSGDPPRQETLYAVSEQGRPSADRGLGALTRYLDRTGAIDAKKLDPVALGLLIAHLDAAPRGFDATTLGETLSPVERRPSVSYAPLTVTLFAVGWTPPSSESPTGLPPGAMMMPGLPPGAAMMPGLPPGAAMMPGLPPGATVMPSGPGDAVPVGPPLGTPVSTLARAVLSVTRGPSGPSASWKVVWRGSQGPFEPVDCPVRP